MRRLAFLILALLPVISYADWEWKTHSAVQTFSGLCEAGGRIWCGTRGGLAAFDPASKNFTLWTNTEGLAANEVTALASDNSGCLWIATSEGMLQYFDPTLSIWRLHDQYKTHRIHCLLARGDTLFVGLDIGVSLFLIGKEEVKETYRQLGLSRTRDYPVRAMAVFDDSIWAATTEGLSKAPLKQVNLLDPLSWIDVNTIQGRPIETVNAIVVSDSGLCFGADNGLFQTGGSNPLFTESVTDLVLFKGRIVVSTSNGQFTPQNGSWKQLGAFAAERLTASGNKLFAGSGRILRSYDELTDSWEEAEANSPGGNLIAGFDVDSLGTLWAASRDRGFFRFDGSSWTNYHQGNLPGLISNAFVTVLCDGATTWFGSWGGGLVQLDADNVFHFYNAGNGFLAGISDAPSYCVANRLAKVDGGIWILNRASRTQKPLVFMSSDGQWSYYGLNSGIDNLNLTSMIVDEFGRVWLGTDTEGSGHQGLIILDPNGTPGDPSDDPAIRYIGKSNGLGAAAEQAPSVKDLLSDGLGTVWVGTSSGLFYVQNGEVREQYSAPDASGFIWPILKINALAMDGTRRLWIGTDDGLRMFNPATSEWQLFSEETSGLVSNGISSLAADPNSGDIYIGTANGISVLSTPFAAPRETQIPLAAYPNPFIPAEHQTMKIDNLSQGVSVAIFTPSGRRVRHFASAAVPGRILTWDGKDDGGEALPTGIYVAVSMTEDGKTSHVKFALIR